MAISDVIYEIKISIVNKYLLTQKLQYLIFLNLVLNSLKRQTQGIV